MCCFQRASTARLTVAKTSPIADLAREVATREPRPGTAPRSDIENVIPRTLAEVRAAGKDHLTQTEEAVRAVLQTRSDMTASEALVQVNRMRGS